MTNESTSPRADDTTNDDAAFVDDYDDYDENAVMPPTPGPWLIDPDGGDKWIRVYAPDPDPNNYGLGRLEVEVSTDDVDTRVSRANARLISSAPDLRAALERNVAINAAMLAWLDDEDFSCTAHIPDSGGKNECDHCAITGMVKEAGDALKDAEAAIAKATGGQP